MAAQGPAAEPAGRLVTYLMIETFIVGARLMVQTLQAAVARAARASVWRLSAVLGGRKQAMPAAPQR